jgi:hypothetical protein
MESFSPYAEPLLVKLDIFDDCPRQGNALIDDCDRIHADDDVNQFKAKLGCIRQALPPVAPDRVLPLQPPINNPEPLNDERARHFEIISIVRQHPFNLVAVPAFDPIASKFLRPSTLNHV